MTEYMNQLTSSSLDNLAIIISCQYRKFCMFYKLVSEYSALITKVKYEFKSISSLDVVLVFKTKRDLNVIRSELESAMEEYGYEGTLTNDKKNIYMSIHLEEEPEPSEDEDENEEDEEE